MKSRLFCCALLLAFSISARAEYVVNDPFARPDARRNFSQCFPEVKPEDLERMANMTRFGYDDFGPTEVCSANDPNCKPGTQYFQVLRRMHFAANQLAQQPIQSAVMSAEGGSCSYTRMRNFRYSMSRNRIDVHVHPFRQERKCAFGAKTDWSSAEADVDIWAVLEPDFTLSQGQRVYNERSSLFGFIDGQWLKGILGSPIAILVGGVQIPFLAKLLIDSRGFSGVNTDTNFAQGGVNLYMYSGLQSKLDSLGTTVATPYQNRRELSGFVQNKTTAAIEIVQSARALESTRDHFSRVRKLEVDFLSSLGEVEPKKRVVAPGDNLWKIVQAEYLDARLHVLVGGINGLKRGEKLHPGQILQLPRWHDLCKRLGGNPSAVLKGESLWSKVRDGDLPKDLRRINTYSGKPSLIYPLEVLEVKPEFVNK